MNKQISIFCSSIRPWSWSGFFDSLKSTSIDYEIIFSGPLNQKEVGKEYNIIYPENFIYIQTANIKPAQCYEVARKECSGETVSWVADDCEFSEDCYGKAYNYWKSLKNDKIILSLQTIEDGLHYNMRDHSFVGFNRNTPLMAPVCFMSKKFLEELGGFDRRFICGQYENSLVMRAYEAGGNVIIYKDSQVIIEHQKKHQNQHKFRGGYYKDRQILEGIWGKHGEKLYDATEKKFEPYEDKNLLIKSQCLEDNQIWV